MRIKRSFIAVLATVLSFSSFAGKVETPSSLDGVKRVTAAQAKAAIDSGAAVYDVRKKAEYLEGHIKGAKSLAYKEKSAKVANFDMSKDRWKVAKLGADKSKTIIVYCNGKTCWKSFKSAKTAAKNGYKNVLWLRGGFPEWKAAGFPVE